MLKYKKIEIHGHRGCRGYFPENTLSSFIHAVNLNLDAIELDVVISKDLQVVVSHEPFMHRKKCLWPNLIPISKEQEQLLYLFQLNYEEIKKFDCGLLAHANYPLVKLGPAYKPLLTAVITAVEKECREKKRTPIKYNIELKSEPHLIGYAQPGYEQYINLVLDTVKKFNIENRLIIQSFDKEILRTIRKLDTKIVLSLLIEDSVDPLQHIEQLGFIPDILASDYIYLNAENIKRLQKQNVKVFAFTVNQISAIENQINMGVDAIISDYPDIIARCLSTYKYPEK